MPPFEDGLPPLREVVRRHGIEPNKALGQNFLFDLNLTHRIARAGGSLAGKTVFEIGPGPGGLTRALLAEGADVIAVERDRRCLAALAEIADHYPGRLRVIEGDALEIGPDNLAVVGRPIGIVANLPYNIATVLLIRWLETEPWPPWFDRMTLMFQREVAERIVATPAMRADYGRLAVLSNWRAETRILFDIAPSAFVPPPKVVSSLVELVPRPMPSTCSLPHLGKVTVAAFGQRRKMLRQSLRTLSMNGAAVDVPALLAAAGLDGSHRAETLSIDDFVALARALENADASRQR